MLSCSLAMSTSVSLVEPGIAVRAIGPALESAVSAMEATVSTLEAKSSSLTLTGARFDKPGIAVETWGGSGRVGSVSHGSLGSSKGVRHHLP